MRQPCRAGHPLHTTPPPSSTPSTLPRRAICLACFQPAVLPWILPFKSNKDKPRPAHGALTGKSITLFWFTTGFGRFPSPQTYNDLLWLHGSQKALVASTPAWMAGQVREFSGATGARGRTGLPLTDRTAALALKCLAQARAPGLAGSLGGH